MNWTNDHVRQAAAQVSVRIMEYRKESKATTVGLATPAVVLQQPGLGSGAVLAGLVCLQLLFQHTCNRSRSTVRKQ